MTRHQTTLTELARLGFAELGETSERLHELGMPSLVPHFAVAADPDQALRLLGSLRESAPKQVDAVLADDSAAARLIQVLGASAGLGEFFSRHPDQLDALAKPIAQPLTPAEYESDLMSSVEELDRKSTRLNSSH